MPASLSISYTYRERSKVKWDSKKTPRFNLQYWEGWGEPDSAMIGLGWKRLSLIAPTGGNILWYTYRQGLIFQNWNEQ